MIQIRIAVITGKKQPQILISIQSIQVINNSDVNFLCSFIYSYNNYDYVDYPVQQYSSSPVIRVLQQIIRMAKNGKKIFSPTVIAYHHHTLDIEFLRNSLTFFDLQV